jgi:hypothetical protein
MEEKAAKWREESRPKWGKQFAVAKRRSQVTNHGTQWKKKKTAGDPLGNLVVGGWGWELER